MTHASSARSQKPFWLIAALSIALLLAQDFLANLIADLRDGPLECLAGQIAGWLGQASGQRPVVAACQAYEAAPQPHHIARVLIALLLLWLVVAIARQLWSAYAQAVEVRGEGELLAAGRFEAVVLPVSRPLRRGAQPDSEWEQALRDGARRLRAGEAGLTLGRIGEREVAAQNLGIDDLCHPEFVWTLGVALPFRDLAWQQGLRVIRRAAESLDRGETLNVYCAPSQDTAALQETFAAVLAVATHALRGAVVLNIRAARRAIDLKELRQTSDGLKNLVADVRRAVKRGGMIVLDITGGSRAYAAAATLASLGDDVCFAYVVGGPGGGYEVNIYDVAVSRSG